MRRTEERENVRTRERVRMRDYCLLEPSVLKTLLLILLCWSSTALAQVAGDPFARARRLVNDGDAKMGRAVVDSMLAAATPNSPSYAEALYWRGVLAEAGEAARSDLLRVAIEFPLSPRSSDALLRLAQLEFTRGDRVAALRHLDQLAREHPDAPSRAAGRYWTARVLFEDGKSTEACAALRDAKSLAPARDVELVNQIEYYLRPCFTAALIVDSLELIDRVGARADSGRTAVGGARRPAAKGRWSVQVAAYGDHGNAQALVRKLKARGIDARVTPDKPWRVRVGHFVTRAEAAEVAQQLSSKGSKALVVEAEKR